jgi:hypothetical protein
MTEFRAILVCEDARVDESGALWLAKVFGDRLIAPVPQGPIVMERLSIVAIVAGLTGADWIGIRHTIRARGSDPAMPVLSFHPHDPKHAEHNFIFGHERLVLGDGGAFELDVEIHVRGQITTGHLAFSVERRA